MARKKPDTGISVHIDTTDRKAYTPTEWAALVHRTIVIACTLEPTAPGHTREELLGLYRWYAGFIARVAVTLEEGITNPYTCDPPHWCYSDDNGGRCGVWAARGLYDPRASVRLTTFFDGRRDYPQPPPRVLLVVPTQLAKRWVEDCKELIAEMLAADSAPLEPEAQPDHTGPALIETHTAEQEQRR